MIEEFKVADVVVLKSGGPKMTIQVLRESQEGSKAFCKYWFQPDQKFIEDWFFLSNLSKSE